METLGLHTHTHICIRKFDVYVHIHELVYPVKVPETMKDKFFCINAEVWNEFHIIWESLQTPIFSI